MPFNGSGSFSTKYNWQNDAALGLNISSSRMQGQDQDMADGLSLCLTKDGQQTPIANIPMGGFRITNLGTPTNPNDATTKNYVDNFLASSTGSSLIGFIQSGTGAILRTAQDKMRETVSVKDFGALGDGSTIDTAAWVAAVAYLKSVGGGTLYAPAGQYMLDATITIDFDNFRLRGDGFKATKIAMTNASANIFTLSGTHYTFFEDVCVYYPGTVTITTASIIFNVSSCNSVYFHKVFTDSCYLAYNLISSAVIILDKVQAYSYVQDGLYASACNDIYVTNFIFNAADLTGTLKGQGAGFHLNNAVQTFIALNGEVNQGMLGLKTEASNNISGARPAFCYFVNVLFDSSAQGAAINALQTTVFVNCWFSNGRTGIGYSGLTINSCETVSFVGTIFHNSGANGCVMQNGAKRVTFNGCLFSNNSVTTGVGVSHGLAIGAGTTDFVVTNCNASNLPASTSTTGYGQQNHGVALNAGASNNFIVSGNYCYGNNGTGISIGTLSAFASGYVGGNIGFVSKNSGSSAIPTGSTSVSVTHGLGYTPSPNDISMTPQASTTAGAYVDSTSITSTAFTVRIASAPASNANFAWQARCLNA